MPSSYSKSVEDYLDRIPKFQSVGSKAAKFDLSRVKSFSASIGNPHEDFPAIHVAGTNGKGSVCHILGAIFQSSEYKVGVYTSPHIFNYNERFRINDDYISDKELITFFERYEQTIEDHKLTYFEISTAIAFWWFARSKVDIAVIEVGLGGRLDATNILDPLVSVITSISLDHTDILGENIEEIAREKGGIIKPNRPVVIGDLPQLARNEIYELAEQNQAPVHTIEEIVPTFCEPGHYQLTLDDEQLDVHTNFVAPVQAKNIAIAWQVIRLIRDQFAITKRQFILALQHVSLGFGRFERLVQKQAWYFDGGHNLEAVKQLKESIKTVGAVKDAVLILALMKDKIRPDVMNEFLEFKNIYYYQLNLERAATFDDIKQWLPQAKSFPDDQKQQLLLDNFDSELVIFSGSFYFYDTVRDWVSTFALNQ